MLGKFLGAAGKLVVSSGNVLRDTTASAGDSNH